MEDDISLVDNAANLVEALVDFSAKNTIDFVKFSANRANNKKKTCISAIKDAYELVKFSSIPVMSKGQLVSNAACKAMIEKIPHPAMPIDVMFRHEWLLPFMLFNIEPQIVFAAPFSSTTGEKHRKKKI